MLSGTAQKIDLVLENWQMYTEYAGHSRAEVEGGPGFNIGRHDRGVVVS